jgi:hypothetical protein
MSRAAETYSFLNYYNKALCVDDLSYCYKPKTDNRKISMENESSMLFLTKIVVIPQRSVIKILAESTSQDTWTPNNGKVTNFTPTRYIL